MTQQTQKQGKTYDWIYGEAEKLSSDVDNSKEHYSFPKYIWRLNALQRMYISQFNKASSIERNDCSLLLEMLQNQIHGRLDVFRAQAMSGELRATVKNRQEGKK